MGKFRVGDRVKRIYRSCSEVVEGQIYTVCDFGLRKIKLNEVCGEYNPDYFELVPPKTMDTLEAGDIIQSGNKYSAKVLERVGTVIFTTPWAFRVQDITDSCVPYSYTISYMKSQGYRLYNGNAPKEVTMEELNKILGYEVKIKK